MQLNPYPQQPQQQLQDPLRVPRRQLDPEDILDIIRRNKSWIAGPALAGLVLSVVVAFLWPDTYISTAVIRVVPPQVPASYVPPNVTVRTSQRINSMAQEILSRAALTSIIETYNLYPRERQRLPLEDVIEKMRKAIDIGDVRILQSRRRGGGGNLTAFQISFAYENRYLAQKVAADLANRFITENIRERSSQSALTTQFLRDQWQAAKNELEEIERKITEFRIKHAGQLPDQWSANIQRATALESRAASLNGALARLQQEKLVLESEIRVLRNRINSIAKAPGATAGGGSYLDPRVAALNEQIRAAERTLAGLMQTYTENHPDVKRVEAQIESLRKRRAKVLSETAALDKGEEKSKPVRALTPAQAAEIRRLNDELQRKAIAARAKDLEIENTRRELEQVNARIAEIQARVQQAPVGQQEYASLMRDLQLKQRRYDELSLKVKQSELATNLESRNQGESLELLDPASLPERPAQPVRSVIILMGVFVGFGVGGVLVFLREIRDTSLKTLKDVRAYTQLPVLGSIPLLENDVIVMRRRRMAWLAWVAACLFAAAVMGGSIYYYYATKV